MGDRVPTPVHPQFGAIAIGRNEGERLRRCLGSLSEATVIVYVDSGSSYGSVQLACDKGVEVVELDTARPFTAARARNAGFRRLRNKLPDLRYAQFVDADCELRQGWAQKALSFLETQHDV